MGQSMCKSIQSMQSMLWRTVSLMARCPYTGDDPSTHEAQREMEQTGTEACLKFYEEEDGHQDSTEEHDMRCRQASVPSSTPATSPCPGWDAELPACRFCRLYLPAKTEVLEKHIAKDCRQCKDGDGRDARKEIKQVIRARKAAEGDKDVPGGRSECWQHFVTVGQRDEKTQLYRAKCRRGATPIHLSSCYHMRRLKVGAELKHFAACRYCKKERAGQPREMEAHIISCPDATPEAKAAMQRAWSDRKGKKEVKEAYKRKTRLAVGLCLG